MRKTILGLVTAALVASLTMSCSALLNMIGDDGNVTSVILDQSYLYMTVGNTIQLDAQVMPSNATDRTVFWSSSNTLVASVSAGYVTANGAGTATIRANSKADSSKFATCTVTVSAQTGGIVAVTGISLNNSYLYLTQGVGQTLVASVYPSNASNQTLGWSSGNTNIASVSNGYVYATGVGTTTITVYSQSDPSKSASCQVTVSQPTITHVNSITFVSSSVNLQLGQTYDLQPAVYPSTATNPALNWTYDSSVVTVNNGIVTAQGAGSTTITATSASDQNVYASCQVTVTSTTGTTVTMTDAQVAMGALTPAMSSMSTIPQSAYFWNASYTSATIYYQDPANPAILVSGSMTMNQTTGSTSSNFTIQLTNYYDPTSGYRVSGTLLFSVSGETTNMYVSENGDFTFVGNGPVKTLVFNIYGYSTGEMSGTMTCNGQDFPLIY